MRTQNIPFQCNKENHTKLSQSCSYGIFPQGLKNEFETAVVNEPSVFEPMKFYCTLLNQKYGKTDLEHSVGQDKTTVKGIVCQGLH